jgi:hypothetical protein
MNRRAVRYPGVGRTEVTLAENIQASVLFCSEKSEKIETDIGGPQKWENGHVNIILFFFVCLFLLVHFFHWIQLPYMTNCAKFWTLHVVDKRWHTSAVMYTHQTSWICLPSTKRCCNHGYWEVGVSLGRWRYLGSRYCRLARNRSYLKIIFMVSVLVYLLMWFQVREPWNLADACCRPFCLRLGPTA